MQGGKRRRRQEQEQMFSILYGQAWIHSLDDVYKCFLSKFSKTAGRILTDFKSTLPSKSDYAWSPSLFVWPRFFVNNTCWVECHDIHTTGQKYIAKDWYDQPWATVVFLILCLRVSLTLARFTSHFSHIDKV